MNGTCPQTAVLADYLAGRVTDPQAREVEGHLRGCRPCQQALVQSTPGSDSLLRAVRTTPTGDPGQSEPELAVALKMIGTLHAATTQPGAAKDAAADTGRLISNYELQKKLGEGGMGAVYLARHLRLKKAVAIKLLKGDRSRDDGAIARFQVEIEAVGKLEHPHIVRALDAGEEKGTHFLVMEYLAGIDLARLVRGLGPIGLADACELIRQAALGLNHAHENNVIHRDVKPSNLMLLAGGKVKVLDLGLAHFRPDWSESVGLTGDHQVLGTLLYVAPEQLAPGGKVDARSDIFSLGVTLIEVLLGRVPPKQGFAVALSDHERSARTDVPPDIWQLAARMTASQPADRPPSMLAIAETLRPWCVGANLVQLLARLAGRTTFADPRLPEGGVTPQIGVTGSAAADSADDLGVQEVIPPPITTSLPVGEATAVKQKNGWRSLHPLGTWMVGGGVLAAMLLVAYPLVRNTWQQGPERLTDQNQRLETVPPGPGSATVTFFDPTYEELIRGILDQRKVIALAEGTQKKHLLHIGVNDLPAGNYVLQGAGDDWEIEPQPFTVAAGETTEIVPLVRFRTPWKYPRIPLPGQQVIYSGSLTLRGPAAAEARPTPFSLTITALGDKNVDGKRHRWLQFELAHKLHDFRETAYLLVNVENYPDQPRLIVAEGWVEATSKRIAAALSRRLPDAPSPSLAAEFQPATDTLLEAAEKVGVSLPPDRIGIHTPLVLLFGADCNASLPQISSARALMPAPTRFELGNMDTGQRIFPGLMITAEATLPAADPEADPLRIELTVKRSETVPFSFVNIHLDSPALAADLKVDSHTELAKPLEGLAAAPTERLAIAVQAVQDLDGEPSALDVATLPRADGEGVSYTGMLEIPTKVKLTYDAQLRVLGSEAIDGRPHRWLNVVVVTKLPGSAHREEAALLIDELEFRQHGKLVASRGWFKAGKHWLPFTTTERPIEAIEEELCLLGSPLPAMRLGVHDVLALISKTSLQSMFGDVRAQFAHWSSLKDVTPRPVPVAEFIYGTAGKSVAADVWNIGEKGGTPSFQIVRSHEVPFDFVNVQITTPTGITFTAAATEVFEVSPEDLARISLPDAGAWDALMDAHNKTVKTARLAQPNWRLWSMRLPDGAVVRQWAEYGGKALDKILLRDMAGAIRPLPEAMIDDEDDRLAIKTGRWWHNMEGKPFLHGELISWEHRQGKAYLMMRRSDGDRRDLELTLSRFDKELDRPLLEQLMRLIPANSRAGATRGPVRGMRGR